MVLTSLQPEGEFKEFESRLKFETWLKHGIKFFFSFEPSLNWNSFWDISDAV